MRSYSFATGRAIVAGFVATLWSVSAPSSELFYTKPFPTECFFSQQRTGPDVKLCYYRCKDREVVIMPVDQTRNCPIILPRF